MQHEWIKSTLGHGEMMCRHCRMTNREAQVLRSTMCKLRRRPVGTADEGAQADNVVDLFPIDFKRISDGVGQDLFGGPPTIVPETGGVPVTPAEPFRLLHDGDAVVYGDTSDTSSSDNSGGSNSE